LINKQNLKEINDKKKQTAKSLERNLSYRLLAVSQPAKFFGSIWLSISLKI
jgi:hypothetical protein